MKNCCSQACDERVNGKKKKKENASYKKESKETMNEWTLCVPYLECVVMHLSSSGSKVMLVIQMMMMVMMIGSSGCSNNVMMTRVMIIMMTIAN